MKTFLDYGRYNDDPEHVGCPFAKTDMTPCAARDGASATDNGDCVGCLLPAADLLKDLVWTVTDPFHIKSFVDKYIDEHYPDAQLDG